MGIEPVTPDAQEGPISTPARRLPIIFSSVSEDVDNHDGWAEGEVSIEIAARARSDVRLTPRE